MSNILVLGGTQFLGRNFVETLLKETNHSVTLCNRGISNPDLFKDINRIICDRNIEDDCQKIFGNFYDFVFDFSGYTVPQLANVSKYLRCHKYIFISTVSVLYEFPNDRNLQIYADNKRDCELFVDDIYTNFTIVRCPCVVGDHDNTDRFIKKENEFFWKSTGQKAVECITPDKLTKALLLEIDFTPEIKLLTF